MSWQLIHRYTEYKSYMNTIYPFGISLTFFPFIAIAPPKEGEGEWFWYWLIVNIYKS